MGNQSTRLLIHCRSKYKTVSIANNLVVKLSVSKTIIIPLLFRHSFGCALFVLSVSSEGLWEESKERQTSKTNREGCQQSDVKPEVVLWHSNTIRIIQNQVDATLSKLRLERIWSPVTGHSWSGSVGQAVDTSSIPSHWLIASNSFLEESASDDRT